MTLKDISAKISELEAGFKSLFADKQSGQAAELKSQLDAIQATVNGSLTESLAKIDALTAANLEAAAFLDLVNKELVAQDKAVVATLETLAIDVKPEANFQDKLDAIKTSVSTAISKIGVTGQLPVTGTLTAATNRTRAEFNAMSPEKQMEFVKSGGKLV